MAGFKKGSQTWYDKTRQALVDNSKKLRDKNISESERERLGRQHERLINDLDVYYHEGLVNNPLKLS